MLRSRLLWELVALFVVGLVLYFLGVRLTKADLHVSAAAEPLACLGGTKVGEQCFGNLPIIVSFPITNALIMTVVVDLALVLTIVFGARSMKLIPQGFQNSVETIVEAFYNFAMGVDRKNVAKFF